MRLKKNMLALLSWVLLLLTLAFCFAIAPISQARGQDGRYILSAKSDADYDGLKQDVVRSGGKIVKDMPEIDMLVVSAPASAKQAMASSQHASGISTDQVRNIVQPGMQQDLLNVPANKSPSLDRTLVNADGSMSKKLVTPDPAYFLPGLLWNLDRVRAPQAWSVTTGSPAVTVGVADTGLDFTHKELQGRISDVVDLTVNEDPPLCKTYFGKSDQELAAQYNGPVTTDWNGHGTWIGGNIAADLDGVGINGIAPNIKLVALKISQWCGSAYDSTILDSFTYAAKHGINIVSISFGGYLDLSDPDQKTIYRQYQAAVDYAWRKGTVIVAAAGNEHLRIGDGGKVISHGPLTSPGATFVDYYGLYENPGGIRHVVDVSSTGNLVNVPSDNCAPGTTGSTATCKPASDPHQAAGIGKKNQLAYYSNYGPRIDIAAPGGARKFNLPVWDRGGTPGWPVTTADGFNAWEDFSITSNWATQIPCYTINLPGFFYTDQCYSTIQGTSMATPHVSAVMALVASKYPELRHDSEGLVEKVKDGARQIDGNRTRALSATDTSPGDQSGLACPGGYCHLSGPTISDSDAYGAGLVDAYGALYNDRRGRYNDN
ncbi:MAG TPA: S8 family serine peptidase [Chloroflexia bacterium]|nr:S8 family serine peptidase [Chloroflexia bacterium]